MEDFCRADRADCGECVTTVWRQGTLEDYAGILKCHHELEDKLGQEMDLPKFSDPAVLVWMVAERDGEIVQFLTMERLVEMRMGGDDVEALQELIKQAPAVLAKTRQAGVRFLNCPVPRAMEKNIGRHLKPVGFHPEQNVVFVAILRGQDL
jgi:hypothetical protein